MDYSKLIDNDSFLDSILDEDIYIPVSKPSKKKLEKEDKKDCFARISPTRCNALIIKDCKGCAFYKKRNEIKNNPFYAYSYRSLKKHDEDMKKHRINPDDVIY